VAASTEANNNIGCNEVFARRWRPDSILQVLKQHWQKKITLCASHAGEIQDRE
jgi:hypothetical protein